MEVATVASSRGEFAGEKPYQGKLGPLRHAKRLQKLLFSVLKSWTNGINRGDRQATPRGVLGDWEQGTAYQGSRSNEIFWLVALTYSYRKASTGSSFEARSAGTRPLITPTINNTIVDSVTVISEMRR